MTIPSSPAVLQQKTVGLTVNGRQQDVHFRYSVAPGKPVLMLLHPSPLSSAFLVPLAQRLAGRASIIAPDTPGYGASPALAGEVTSLEPYVAVLSELATDLGLERFGVYGSATGAQIAIELGKADPRVSGLMLDNAASFTDTEVAAISAGYFPDITPRADGGHIAAVWQLARQMTQFFPWHKPTWENRIGPALGPVAALDATVMGYLDAGPAYDVTYRAAFANERVDRLQAVTVPAVVLRWPGSIIRRYTDRFDNERFADNIVMAHCGATMEERWVGLEDHLSLVLDADGPEVFATGSPGSRAFVDVPFGQVCYRPSAGRPTRILLPGLGGSIAAVDPADISDSDVLLDLPGHGLSSAPELVTIAHCTDAVAALVSHIDQSQVVLAGFGAAHELAIAIANNLPGVSPGAAALPWPQPELPDLQPCAAGGQWWRAWYALCQWYLDRDMALPEPARLTRLMLDMLRSQQARQQLLEALDV